MFSGHQSIVNGQQLMMSNDVLWAIAKPSPAPELETALAIVYILWQIRFTISIFFTISC